MAIMTLTITRQRRAIWMQTPVWLLVSLLEQQALRLMPYAQQSQWMLIMEPTANFVNQPVTVHSSPAHGALWALTLFPDQSAVRSAFKGSVTTIPILAQSAKRVLQGPTQLQGKRLARGAIQVLQMLMEMRQLHAQGVITAHTPIPGRHDASTAL